MNKNKTIRKLSNCCKAEVSVEGDITRYYYCLECYKTCDLYIKPKKEKKGLFYKMTLPDTIRKIKEDMTKKEKKLPKQFICPHCKGDIRIRNPKGYCDHLYYPEYCDKCQEIELDKSTITKRKYDLKSILKANIKREKERKDELKNLENRIFQHESNTTGTKHEHQYCPTCQLYIKKLNEL